MPILTKPAFGPRVALGYVTVGALMCVWTLVWYFTRESPMTPTRWFWVSGIFLSGLTFVFLGVILGPLGRAAREAEMPPTEVTGAEAAIQQTSAANPPAVAVAPPGTNPAALPSRPAAPAQPGAPISPQPAH
jgi:hypothetical protein